jgi:hypothetical protein
MLSRQRLIGYGVVSLLICSVLLVTGYSQEEASKRTVQFSDLLTLRREIPLVTPDSSLEPSGFLFLAPWRSNIVASDGTTRRFLIFDSTGHWSATWILDTLTGPQCLGKRLICVSGHESQVYSYDPRTNSVFRRDRGGFEKIPLSKWNVNRWGATKQRIVAVGAVWPDDPKNPMKGLKTSVRAIAGSQITPICDITKDLEYPQLYGQIGTPNAICTKEDDGFYVLEAASMKILEYSPDGKLLRRSTEVPEGFIPPSADSNFSSMEDMCRLLGNFTGPVSFGRIGKYLLVTWAVMKEATIYLEVYDESLRLRLTKIKVPGEELDPMNMYTSGRSLFLLRRSASCKLPNYSAEGTRLRSTSPPVLVEFTFNESVVENS